MTNMNQCLLCERRNLLLYCCMLLFFDPEMNCSSIWSMHRWFKSKYYGRKEIKQVQINVQLLWVSRLNPVMGPPPPVAPTSPRGAGRCWGLRTERRGSARCRQSTGTSPQTPRWGRRGGGRGGRRPSCVGSWGRASHPGGVFVWTLASPYQVAWSEGGRHSGNC